MDWNATLYDDKHAFVYAKGDSLLEMLRPQSYERILDLGCGTGFLTNEMAKSCQYILGIDSSQEMIVKAKTEFPELDFQVANAIEFQASEPFHAIFSNAVLHWILEPEKAIQHLYQNLVPGGRLVLEFGGKGNIQNIIETLNQAIVAFGFQAKPISKQWFFPSISEYTTLLEHQGFEVQHVELFDRPTPLDDPETGIIDWLSMFASGFLEHLDKDVQEQIKKQTQEQLKPLLFKENTWFADYRRIRIIAK